MQTYLARFTTSTLKVKDNAMTSAVTTAFNKAMPSQLKTELEPHTFTVPSSLASNGVPYNMTFDAASNAREELFKSLGMDLNAARKMVHQQVDHHPWAKFATAAVAGGATLLAVNKAAMLYAVGAAALTPANGLVLAALLGAALGAAVLYGVLHKKTQQQWQTSLNDTCGELLAELQRFAAAGQKSSIPADKAIGNFIEKQLLATTRGKSNLRATLDFGGAALYGVLATHLTPALAGLGLLHKGGSVLVASLAAWLYQAYVITPQTQVGVKIPHQALPPAGVPKAAPAHGGFQGFRVNTSSVPDTATTSDFTTSSTEDVIKEAREFVA